MDLVGKTGWRRKTWTQKKCRLDIWCPSTRFTGDLRRQGQILLGVDFLRAELVVPERDPGHLDRGHAVVCSDMHLGNRFHRLCFTDSAPLLESLGCGELIVGLEGNTLLGCGPLEAPRIRPIYQLTSDRHSEPQH